MGCQTTKALPSRIKWRAVRTHLEREHTLPAATVPGVVRVPFTSFAQPSWAPSGALDLQNVTQLSIYLGGAHAGGPIVDDVRAYPSGA